MAWWLWLLLIVSAYVTVVLSEKKIIRWKIVAFPVILVGVVLVILFTPPHYLMGVVAGVVLGVAGILFNKETRNESDR